MPDKIKNPFIVEVEAPENDLPSPKATEEQSKPKTISDAKPLEPSVKIVAKPVVVPEPEPQGTKIQWGMFFAGVATTTIVCGLSFGAWWMYSQRVALPAVIQPTPSPMVLATPAPTPQAPVLSRSGIKVDVLNGTGEVGKAGSTATQIAGLGYAKGTTGNTDIQTGSTLSFSSDIATLSAVIVKDISSVIENVTASETTLKGNGLVQLVIGK